MKTMVSRIQGWLRDGHRVVIFTSRVSKTHLPSRIKQEKETIQIALHDMGLPELAITANKSPHFSEIWDDRAVRVERNTGLEIG